MHTKCDFVSFSISSTILQDRALPIGFHATISSPHIHALGLELIEDAIKKVEHPHILDVGSGSGYLTYCFGLMVKDKGGSVIGIDHVTEFIDICKNREDDPSFPEHLRALQKDNVISFVGMCSSFTRYQL